MPKRTLKDVREQKISHKRKTQKDAKPTKLSFYDDRRGYYVPSDFANEQNIKRMKEEYTRLRDIARKRLKYLYEGNLYSQSFFDKQYEKIPMIREMYADSNGSQEVFRVQLASALSDVSKLLNVGPSTVRRAEWRNDKLKSDFDRDWNHLKMHADKTLPGALDDIDPSKIDPEAFYDLLDYYKEQGDNFNYWTGSELKQLFGLDYESEIVENTPRFLLDALFNPSAIKSEAKAEAKKQINRGIRKVKKAVKKKVKKAIKNHQKAKAKKAKQKAKQAAKKGTGKT